MRGAGFRIWTIIAVERLHLALFAVLNVKETNLVPVVSTIVAESLKADLGNQKSIVNEKWRFWGNWKAEEVNRLS